MNLFKRIPWWAWLALPGGLLVALWARGRQSKVAGPTGALTRAGAIADAEAVERSLVDQAVARANVVREGVANNPLAAQFLGVSPSLVQVGDPTKVAADSAAADAIRQEISDDNAKLAYDRAQYQANHNGGQTPQQEAGIEGALQAAIASLMAKLSALVGA